MSRADFYIMDHDKSMRWVGSLSKNGDPYNIPFEILGETSEIMFEDKVDKFLETQTHGIPYGDRFSKWPWQWEDSRMTEYSYIYHLCTGKVYVSRLGGRLMDPIKLIQGMDEIGADLGMGIIKFPKMIPDQVEGNGLKSAETV